MQQMNLNDEDTIKKRRLFNKSWLVANEGALDLINK